MTRSSESRTDDRGNRIRFYRPIALFALCALAAGALAACGGGGSSSGGSDTGGGTTSGGNAETTASTAEPVSVAMVETFSAIPFFQIAKEGAEAAADEDGSVDLTIQSPQVPNGTNEATMAANLLANEPDGFAPNPCVLPAWTRVLKEMTEQVPNGNVVAWGCAPVSEPSQSTPVTTYVGVNRKEEGRVLTEALIEEAGFDSSTTGSVLIGNCAKGTPVLDESAEAVEEVFKKELPKAEIVSFAGQVEQAKNTSAWSSELANHPDAIAALGACGQDNVSILSATKSGGMNIAIGLFNPNEAELKAQQSGRVDASVSEQPWTQGYMTIKLLTEGARGTALPEGWINPGVLTITAENVDEFLKASTGGTAEAEFSKPYAEEALAQARSGENVEPIGAVTE